MGCGSIGRAFKKTPADSSAITPDPRLDEPFWFGSGSDAATCRAIVEHARLIDAADLSFPIILSSDGHVMDGMHRVAKAALLGHETIAAVKFASDLEPDFVDVQPDDLPSEDTINEAPRIA